MKKMAFSLFMCAFMLTPLLLAQRGAAEVTIGGKQIKVEYGQPSLQGRDMLGQLPVGNVWRMGRDAATTLETSAALKFGTQVIEPGTYRLTAKRAAEDRWVLLITKDDSTVEVPLRSRAVDSPVETFTIQLRGKEPNQGMFSMSWGTMQAGARFTVE